MTDTLSGLPVATSSLDGVKDFTRARDRILFRIDTDRFEAAPVLPAEILVGFANRFSDVTEKRLGSEELFAAIRDVLEMVLLPDSFARLSGRLRDKANPVDLAQMSDVIVWLVEQYGLRPTQPSSNSPSGQVPPEPGIGLTASTPEEVSISVDSPSTGS